MSEATRRDMRACPVSDGCLARDSSSRVLSRIRAVASTRAPAPYSANVICRESIESMTTPSKITAHDGQSPHRKNFHAGRLELPADQPHPPAPRDPARRLAQQGRAAGGAGRVDRYLATVFGSGLERGQDA